MALVVGLVATLTSVVAAPYPPVEETFTDTTLPSTPFWSFVSNGDGRIRAMGDTDGATTTELVPVPGAFSSSPASNCFRGNIFFCTNDAFITSHEFYLGRTGAVTVALAVYVSSAVDGQYSRISSSAGVATTGTNFVSSGAVNVPMSTGKYYLIGASWQERSLAYRRNNALPSDVSFGKALDNAVTNIFPAPATITNSIASQAAYRQRITTTVEGVARMDDATADAAYSTNAALLAVDLDGYTNAWLKFRHREPAGGDEADAADGVFLSTNGSDYVQVFDIDETDSNWHTNTVDLFAAAASNGIVLSENTRISFGQMDNEPWPGDGREFDDILVYSDADLHNSDVYPEGASTVTFKGTDIAKAIPLVSEIYKLGGTGVVTDLTVDILYRLRYAGTNIYGETTNWTTTIDAFDSSLEVITNTITVPAGLRLPNYSYTVLSTVDPTNGFNEGNESNNAASQGIFVNQYSGNLKFDNITTDITVTNWSVRANPDSEHIISGTGDWNGFTFAFTNLYVLKDTLNLDYLIDPGETNVIYIDAVEPDEISNIEFTRLNGATLSVTGAWANVQMTLPGGLGQTTSSVSRILSPYLDFAPCKLAQGMYPLPCVDNTTRYFYEEGKPAGLEVSSVTWEPEAGTLTFATTDAIYVREFEVSWLKAVESTLVDPGMATKKSNEQYYQHVDSVSGAPWVRADPGGVAEFTATFNLTPGTNISHFPYDARAEWLGAGTVVVTNDVVDPTASYVDSTTNVIVWYARDCPNTNCSANVGPAYLDFRPASGRLSFSIDGGLVGTGTIVPTNLTWGSITNAGYAQQTDPFVESTFVVAGHFLRGGASVYGTEADYGSGELLLSGILTNAPWAMERPGTAAYDDGDADYAGLNFRVLVDAAKNARSTLGGTVTPDWPLDGVSKYYARASGISGIHQAAQGSFPSNLVIYGYTNTFTYYGLSYLSSEPYESLVEGSIFVPYPSDFTQEYEELMFTCLGELTEAKVPSGGGDRSLDYWQADFTPYTIRFAEQSAASCGNSDRFLAIGSKTFCANVDQPLYGELGFEPDGNLIPQDAGVEGVDSRLRVDNDIELDGPNNEIFTFVPVGDAYYNNFDGETNASGVGFISFSGTVDVPFFEDLKVQFHTSANTNSSTAAIYMMGGWPTDGKGWTNNSGDSFFTTEDYDTHNSAYPTGDVTLAEYRDGSTDAHKVRAIKTWLDVIEFDYALDWSWVSRSFTSFESTAYDFMVLAVEHQVDYMSAENLELSFGVQYDGMPQINLANMAFNAIDESTGMSEAFVNAVGSNVWQTVQNGLSDLDDLLSDVPEPLFDELLDGLVDPVIDSLYDELNAAVQAGTNSLSGIVNAYVSGVGTGVPANHVSAMLSDVVDGVHGAGTIVDDVKSSLDRVIYLIDAFTTNVTIDPYTGDPLPGPFDSGIIATDGDYSVLRDLAAGILGELAGDLAGAIGSELESKIRSFVEEQAPSLEVITETLGELRASVANLRTQLEVGQEFLDELADAVDTNIIQTAADTAAEDINEWLSSLAEEGSAFDEYTAEEIKTLIRQKIDDRFYGTEVVADIQQIMRERLYDLDSAIRESADTVFQQLNQTLRGIASEYLSSVDDSINGLLGDVGDTIGAGQIDGYAHIDQDSLKELRLDGTFQWEAPDAMEFAGYVLFKQLDSDGEAGCGGGSGTANEVSIGAVDVGLGWLGSDLRATIGTKFSFQSTPFKVVGMGGSFEMTEGEIGFESFAITEIAAAVAFGAYENYLSANVRASFSSYEVEGGVFFGRTCTLDPILLWDPLVAGILGDPPFTGIYVYGEGWMPIYDFGCVFNVSAGVGAGVFYFVDGPIGGKILLGADGEALCAVNVRGEVVLAGSKDGDTLRMTGNGTISGSAGVCPICVEFNKSVGFQYDSGSWSVDY